MLSRSFFSLYLRQFGGRPRDGAVLAERARHRELAQLVSNHIFGDEGRQKALAVVNHERQAHEIRRHRRAARPSFNRLSIALLLHGRYFFQQLLVNVWSLADRTAHPALPFPNRTIDFILSFLSKWRLGRAGLIWVSLSRCIWMSASFCGAS